MKNWLGITYPLFLIRFGFWKKFLCPTGFHLFDEVATSEGHYLHCDACELEVPTRVEPK